MNNKNLVVANGVVGLAGGIFLLFASVLLLGTVSSDLMSNSVSSTAGLSMITFIIKVAILILGIIGAVRFKGYEAVGAAPSVLLIVGGALSIVPFLGWIGGILAIIGGSLYLTKIKHFN